MVVTNCAELSESMVVAPSSSSIITRDPPYSTSSTTRNHCNRACICALVVLTLQSPWLHRHRNENARENCSGQRRKPLHRLRDPSSSFSPLPPTLHQDRTSLAASHRVDHTISRAIVDMHRNRDKRDAERVLYRRTSGPRRHLWNAPCENPHGKQTLISGREFWLERETVVTRGSLSLVSQWVNTGQL